VKNLAAEVRRLKGEGGAAPRPKGPSGLDTGNPAVPETPAGPAARPQPGAVPRSTPLDEPSPSQRPASPNRVDQQRAPDNLGGARDPLAEAEAALKKLRHDPNDRQAADALERALQRLKERTDPKAAPQDLAK
jgi:hypothetical protein